jgi:hypothetical protein
MSRAIHYTLRFANFFIQYIAALIWKGWTTTSGTTSSHKRVQAQKMLSDGHHRQHRVLHTSIQKAFSRLTLDATTSCWTSPTMSSSVTLLTLPSTVNLQQYPKISDISHTPRIWINLLPSAANCLLLVRLSTKSSPQSNLSKMRLTKPSDNVIRIHNFLTPNIYTPHV